MALLRVRDLSVVFPRKGAPPVNAVDGISFDVARGQTVGLVGESSCGKSVTAMAIMGLLPSAEVSGSVRFDGTDLLTLPARRTAALRGRELSLVSEDSLSALNPMVPVGVQVSEVIERHGGLRPKQASPRTRELLERVGVPDPDYRMRQYAHELPAGMRHRVLIAMALACRPKLLIADEPTTGLDVTIQAQIIKLLGELVAEMGTALILLTHDLGIVAGICSEVNVLYGGRVVERASRYDLFDHPRHPYTAGLLASVPRLDLPRGRRLAPVRGSVCDTIPWDAGCAFAPRCPNASVVCEQVAPELVTDVGVGRLRCHHPVGDPRFNAVERA